MIVNGYAFAKADKNRKALNLNRPDRAALIRKDPGAETDLALT